MQCPSCGTWYAKEQAFCFCCGAILIDKKGMARLGNYRLLEKIGQGGMGIVYHGIDEGLQRDVAIKVLHQHMLGSPKQVERFRREARMQGKLIHRNIVALLDVYEGDDVLALILELVKGCTLRDYLNYRDIPDWPEIHYITNGILAGLEAAHKHGVIHRDLKPSNIFLHDDGTVKLMDFGLAKPKQSAEEITNSGDTVGTYHYMAPEQITGQGLDARTDLYSLGILLYRMCTGRLPFTSTAGGEFEIMEKQLRHDPIPPRKINRKIPKVLADAITALMQKKPGDRLESCAIVRDMLKPLGKPVQPSLPKGTKGEILESYSQLSIPQQEGMAASESGQQDRTPAEGGHIPANCLLWSFKIASGPAPEKPPLDLRSPPKIERHTLERLRQAIAAVPPLPEIWHHVDPVLADSQATPYDLAKTIEQDPELTSQVLKWGDLAASTTGNGTPMADAALAITRLGMDSAHNLILQALVPKLGAGNRASVSEMQRLWFHSQAIALFSRILSEHSQVVEQRAASRLGLLHDIGKFIILDIEDESTLQKIRQGIADGIPSLKVEWDVIGYTHIDAGMMLAMHWKLPRLIHRFIYFHHHPCWHTPDTWPMDMQPSVMLSHMAHLVLQGMESEAAEPGIWTASRRTHVEGTERLLRNPLCLPLADTALYSQLKQELARLKTMFSTFHATAEEGETDLQSR